MLPRRVRSSTVPCPPALVGSAHAVVLRRKEAAASRLAATLKNKRTMMNLTQHRLWALQEDMLHNMVMGRVLRSYATYNSKLEKAEGHVENPTDGDGHHSDGAESWDETELD